MYLVNPTTLQEILSNIALHLPENYKLVTGNKIQDIRLYYELAGLPGVARGGERGNRIGMLCIV